MARLTTDRKVSTANMPKMSITSLLLSVVLLWCCWGTTGVHGWNHISSKSLEEVLAAQAADSIVLVAFVFPSDPKSQSFEWEWEQAARDITSTVNDDDERRQLQTQLVSIDCSSQDAGNKDLCGRHGLKPDSSTDAKIMLFAQARGEEKMVEYHGIRQREQMLAFIGRMTRPAVTTGISTDEEFWGFMSSDVVTCAAFDLAKKGKDGQDPNDSGSAAADSSYGVFYRLAEKYRHEFSFASVVRTASVDQEDDNDSSDTKKTPRTPLVECLNLQDVVSNTGDWTVIPSRQAIADHIRRLEDPFSSDDPDKLENWLKEVTRPSISELTIWNRQRLLDRDKPIIYLFSLRGNSREAWDSVRTAFSDFARKYHDSLTFVLVDPFMFPDLMPELGLDPNRVSLPNPPTSGTEDSSSPIAAGAVHVLSTNKIYPYPKDRPLTSKALQQWGLDLYQGRVRALGEKEGNGRKGGGSKGTRVVGKKTVNIRKHPGVKINIPGYNNNGGHDEL